MAAAPASVIKNLAIYGPLFQRAFYFDFVLDQPKVAANSGFIADLEINVAERRRVRGGVSWWPPEYSLMPLTNALDKRSGSVREGCGVGVVWKLDFPYD